jgi:hypothetical protein
LHYSDRENALILYLKKRIFAPATKPAAMRTIIALLLLLTSATGASFAQVRPEIIAMAEQLPPLAVTAGAYPFPGIHLKALPAIAFQQAATADELRQLTEHDDPLVRATALFALLGRPERDSLQLERLVPQRFHDTAAISLEIWEEYRSGWNSRVGELFLATIGGYTNVYFWMEDGFQLDTARQAWLDSVFLCSSTNFNSLKRHLYFRWQPQESQYPCLRQLVASGQDNYLAPLLAQYRREEDIGLLAAHLPEGDGERWLSFFFFQHPRLLDTLASRLEEAWQQRSYQFVVARYQNPEAARLLDSVYAQIGRLERKQQQHAVATYASTLFVNYAAIYAPLYLRMLTEHPGNPNFRIPDGLWETHDDTLYRLSLRWKHGDRAERERAAKMMPKIIEYLQAAAPDTLQAEIMRRISLGIELKYYSQYPADMAATVQAYQHIYRSKDPYFIDPLFGLLEKEPLAKNRFFIAKLLLHLGGPPVEARLRAFFQENPGLAPDLRAAEEGGGFYAGFVHYASQK